MTNIVESLTPRHCAFAFLFRGQPTLEPSDGARFFTSLGKTVGVTQLTTQKNQIVLRTQREGKPPNVLQIEVGYFQEGMFRILVFEEFPVKGILNFQEVCDVTWSSFRDIWRPPPLVMAEVTLRYTSAAPGADAVQYLGEKVLRLSEMNQRALGRKPEGVGIRMALPIEINPTENIPVAGASLNILVESLLEDPKRMYYDVRAQWPTVPMANIPIPIPNMPSVLNAEARKPSAYVSEVAGYVERELLNFLGLRR